MNDEIIFLHLSKYIQGKKFELSEEECIELDKNFDKIYLIIYKNSL